jgi:ParB-like chromosome segregation protein Spo0J
MELIKDSVNSIVEAISDMDLPQKVESLNYIRAALHKVSPFKDEPVDNIRWVRNEEVVANDYNPNSVATPEMKLLKLSIEEDGYTQPIVTWSKDSQFEVVDGFHRTRVCKEYEDIKARVHGYIPIVVANEDRLDRGDRIASTIRHNRARGKHGVDSMSDIVVELKRRNWSDKKIGEKLGMDQDEVLRLTQITGLIEMFRDREFSNAWIPEELKEGYEQID